MRRFFFQGGSFFFEVCSVGGVFSNGYPSVADLFTLSATPGAAAKSSQTGRVTCAVKILLEILSSASGYFLDRDFSR